MANSGIGLYALQQLMICLGNIRIFLECFRLKFPVEFLDCSVTVLADLSGSDRYSANAVKDADKRVEWWLFECWTLFEQNFFESCLLWALQRVLKNLSKSTLFRSIIRIHRVCEWYSPKSGSTKSHLPLSDLHSIKRRYLVRSSFFTILAIHLNRFHYWPMIISRSNAITAGRWSPFVWALDARKCIHCIERAPVSTNSITHSIVFGILLDRVDPWFRACWVSLS